MEDTIVAISTALGLGAISIIRVSGKEAINIVNKIFDKKINSTESHTIKYGHIVQNNEIIDEVLVSIMLAPKTYTKEDVIEINCHGGISTTNKVLELLLYNGARLAEPGEFTKRAFLNGRIDLLKAEGVMNLIESKTEINRKISINQLTGKVSNLIDSIREDLIKIISNILVNIDYPEYEDVEVLTNKKIILPLKEIYKKINKIIVETEQGKIIKDGINIGIIGKPNVGKSSLLNTLIEENKAIVTDIEGTTRDIVEGKFILKGLVCNIIDTAGIRNTDNKIEKLGVNKSYQIIENADLIIYMLNNNDLFTNEDEQLLTLIKNKKHIIVVNKVDLVKKLKLQEENYVEISIKEHKGIEELKNKILEIFNLEDITTSDLTYVCSANSLSKLKKMQDILKNSIDNIDKYPIDMIEYDLRNCYNILGEIIGKTYHDDIINEMFSRFCLGK